MVCIFCFLILFSLLLFNPETTNSSSEFAWGDGDIIGTVDADMPNTTIYDSRNQKNRYNSKRQVNIMGVLERYPIPRFRWAQSLIYLMSGMFVLGPVWH